MMEMEGLTAVSSVPNLVFFFLVFLFLYFIAFFFIFPNWDPKLRPEASSCFISLIHGTPAVLLAASAIFSDPSIDFHSPNTPYQNLVLDYSIAYYSIDLCHYLIFNSNDLLFIAHHLATLFVFLTCRYLVFHGAYAILVILILAELTSFCQNAWTLAGARRSDLEFAAKAYQLLSPTFYAIYTIVRCFPGPYFVYRMLVFYMSGVADDFIPRWVWVSWISIIGLAICLGIHWISTLWNQLYKERRSMMILGNKVE